MICLLFYIYFYYNIEEFKYHKSKIHVLRYGPEKQSNTKPTPGRRYIPTAACADQWTECKTLRMRNGRRHSRPFNSHECSRRSPTTLEGKVTCSLVHAHIQFIRFNFVTPVYLYLLFITARIKHAYIFNVDMYFKYISNF